LVWRTNRKGVVMGLARKFKSFVGEWGWEEIVPASGSEPNGDRVKAVFSRDGLSGKFVVAAGGSSYSDVWTYSPTTNTWSQLLASGITQTPAGGGNPNSSYWKAGFCDNNGNLWLNNPWWMYNAGANTSNAYIQKIVLSTGAITTISDSTGVSGFDQPRSALGVHVWTLNYLGSPVPQRYVVGHDASNTTYQTNGKYYFQTNLQDVAAGSASNDSMSGGYFGSTWDQARLQGSSYAVYPYSSTEGSYDVYTISPAISYTSDWTLSAADIVKKPENTFSFSAVSGATSSVTGVRMQSVSGNMNQLVWSQSNGKFFLFAAGPSASCARVFTYEPVAKKLEEVTFSGTSPTHILGEEDGYSRQRGNVGTVVTSGADFYFCRVGTGVDKARIWKFRRN